MKVVEKLASSEGEYVYYDELIGQDSSDVINLRPYFAFYKNFYPPPTEQKATVTVCQHFSLLYYMPYIFNSLPYIGRSIIL